MLHEILTEKPDVLAQRRIRRRSMMGTTLLGLAAISGVTAALFPVVPDLVAVRFVLAATAFVLLGAGGWLINRSISEELRNHRRRLADDVHRALAGTLGVRSPIEIRRQQKYGNGMLVLGAFCLCVMAMPVPHKKPLDSVMWAVFTASVIWVGTLHRLRAIKEMARARAMLEADLSRQTAKAGRHLQRIQ
ncbi:hypothetical protein [Roseateles sp. DXS20W]|uniref:hypothetical protein n=1 Tax=Pelomonas lactea TaxID=3299030 RepID=UPI003747C104